jgi:RNA polymerase sigma-70 factor (ECF subfamily)
VVQDVFLAALQGLAAFEGQSSLRTWLLGIARHKVEDVYRQRLRASLVLDDRNTDEDEPSSETIPLDEQIDHARARAKTRRVLAQLPERYGLVLLWRYWEQRSTREIAAAIGTTDKSVERTLARARARFKELWLKEQEDDRRPLVRTPGERQSARDRDAGAGTREAEIEDLFGARHEDG